MVCTLGSLAPPSNQMTCPMNQSPLPFWATCCWVWTITILPGRTETHLLEWVGLTPMGNLANLLGCGSSSLITPDTKRSSTVKAGWSIGKKGCSSRSSPMQQRNMLSWAIHNLMRRGWCWHQTQAAIRHCWCRTRTWCVVGPCTQNQFSHFFTVAGICGLAPNTSNNPGKNATSDSEADSCKRPHQWGYCPTWN